MLVDMPELKVPRFEVRLVKHDPDHAWEPIRITEIAQIVDIMAPVVTKLDREMFFVVLLDSDSRLIGVSVVAMGELTSTLLHPREVYKVAILANAASIVTVHNHPSGDPTPSFGDVQATAKLIDAGEAIGIPMLDHIIISSDLRHTTVKQLEGSGAGGDGL